MMPWMYGYGWPWMPGMLIGWLLWIVLLIAAIWLIVRWIQRSRASNTSMHISTHEPSAMEILRQRYARGEIDTATFEQMAERLEASRERQPVR